MSKILKVTLASAMLIAGSSMAFAADNNGRGNPGTGGRDIGDKSRSSEQQDQMIDNMPTGSITNCQTQTYDQNGNCVVDPGYQQ